VIRGIKAQPMKLHLAIDLDRHLDAYLLDLIVEFFRLAQA
jgi:hypothetical protein